jgi:hypothetical protein
MFEPYFNYGKSMYQVGEEMLNFREIFVLVFFLLQQGDLQSSYRAIKSSLDIYQNHSDSKQIHDELRKMFSEL